MPTALIIGAGIAGPVAAMALQRAGIDVVVYEAYPAPTTDVGSWLGLQTNGLDALRAIGADRTVSELGVPTASIAFRTSAGRPLGEIPTGRPLPGGSTGLSIKRSDLHRALRDEASRRGITIRHGRRLVGMTSDVDGVVASFTDGSTAAGDLLVGCDGIRSRVRELLNPSGPRARYVPALNVGGYADLVPPGDRPGVLTMAFGRRAFSGRIVTPAGQTWWFANPPRRDEPADGELGRIGDAEWRDSLRRLYEVDQSPIVDLIDATPGPLTGWTTYDLPAVPVWHDDRTVLIGDAAHATSPSSGQGASMAIEDAVVLGQCLRDLPAPRAFARFEALRRPRVERVVAEGRKSSRLRSVGPVGRLARSLVLPLVLKHAAGTGAESLAWMHQHHIDWDAPVTATGVPTNQPS
ncbi:FAD-dependent oxidoreductase [Protofrankia symbiont of Coriaria ruscifolia]|uniref:FAD-dependent oxidoreductase n=1 Tax=Protofrankia symbiont of Coriaria ruscifolia TaxID=1306542 RepID=UPI001041425A|nr:NAD(P)/FAD-dependent oxidoreductase [Protofrankia symbiont of Coriaria ruscifolia]